MIRLYPKVVQREKDIQDLREQLSTRLSENQAQISKRSESAMQIHDLHDQLLASEEEQDRLILEHGVACDKTMGLRTIMDSALEVRSSLLAQLGKSEEEHCEQLKNLALAESESQKCWVSEQRIKSRSAELAEKLSLRSSDLEDLRRKVDESTIAKTRLQGQWEDAVSLATVERGQVRQMTYHVHELWAVAAHHESAASALSDKVVNSEAHAAKIWASMNLVEGQDVRRDELREELRRGKLEVEALRMQLEQQQNAERELSGAESQTMENNEAAMAKLNGHKRRWNLLRTALRMASDRSKQMKDANFQHVQKSAELNARLKKIQQQGDIKIAAEQKSLANVKDEATALQSDHSGLEAKIQELQRNVSQTDTKKEELVTTIAKREEVHAELLVKKAELEAEVEVLKKQFRCVIC